MNLPIWIVVGFQQRDRLTSQDINIDTSYRPPVSCAQCIIGTEKHPDAGILKHHYDYFFQGYGQIEAFRALSKNDILQSYITDQNFRSANDDYDMIFYVMKNTFSIYDIKKIPRLPKPKKVECKFFEDVPAGVNG